MPCSAYSSEYLADTFLAGKRLGNYFVYNHENTYIAEQRLFQDLGFPVKEDTPLEYLKGYMNVKFDPVNQVLLLTPEDPLYFKKFRSIASTEYVDYKDKDKKLIDWKNIDYSIYHNSYSSGQSSDSYYVRTTGKVLDYTYDIFSMPKKNFLSLEKNSSIQLKLGYVPEHSLYGVMLSNELPSMYLNSFGEDVYVPGFPVGSNVDIFRNNEYLESITYTGQPIKLPLMYGFNAYTLIAKTPDGKIVKETLTKDIASFLIPPGQLRYRFSVGQDVNSRKNTFYTRGSYGLTPNVSLSAQLTDKEQSAEIIGRLFNSITYMLGPAHSEQYGRGYKLNISHNNLFINHVDYEKYRYTALTGYLPVWKTLSLSLNHSKSEVNITRKTGYRQDRLSLFGFVYNLFISTWIGRSETTPGDSRDTIYGVRALYSTRKIQLDTEYNVQTPVKNPSLSQDTFSFGANYRTNYGDLKVSQTYKAYPYESMKIEKTTVTLSLYNLKPINIQGRYEYSHRNNSWTFYVMLSGSFSPTNGFTNKSLSGQSMVCFIPYADDNLNSEKDISEKQVSADIEIQSYKSVTANQFFTPCVELSPDVEYRILFSDSFGYVPAQKAVKIKPDRGKILNVYMPYIEVVDIEGNTGKDGMKIKLIRKDTHEVISTTTTRFGGFYMFQIPKNLKDMVIVSIDTTS
jgi:hypothetical protein